MNLVKWCPSEEEAAPDPERDDEMENDILPSRKGSTNAHVEVREPEKNDFVSDGKEYELDEEEEIELKSDKELDKN
ncbi:hypothetical protein FNV43_RR16946 [Rhamnella rubrinervis]|uniref:Uncharacterized protein n=1 Tax=Rhamnella rubrinervis TaxID=2594499 RepID=A0A8K0GZT3_9ROSA|nr:hypothetical protein FNV43_RR16946 [Rhamnella rubrinervis]